MKRLQDKVAIVTGGGNGIGAAISKRLAAEGAVVYVADLDLAAATSVAEEISAAGDAKAVPIEADISDELQVAALVGSALNKSGALHILINNAATFVFAAAEDVTGEELERAFAVNVKGTALAMKHAAQAMRKNGGTNTEPGGAIVNISSISSLIAQPGFLPYSMTKGAVAQMTRNAAVDLSKWGIRVNAINPGPVLTDGTRREAASKGQTLEEVTNELVSRLVIGRMGRPEEIASVAAFLASEDASFMTGASVNVDGGWTIH